MDEDDLRYRAVQSRDSRFDGCFFVGVTTTGIYCRPSCASVVPRRDRVRFFRTAAAAQRDGFRACKRCRPDASPGSPEWNRRSDVVGRAMQAIADGIVDREGVSGLAASLGYSTRQLNRLLLAEVGAGPLELARAQRAQIARVLLEGSDLRAAEVAFAAGFGSVRQFNDTIREVFAETPTDLRRRGRRLGRVEGTARPPMPPRTGPPGPGIGGGTVSLRLALRPPMPSLPLFGFLAARAVPGIEAGDATTYRRTLTLPHGAAVAEVEAPRGDEPFLRATLRLEDLRDLVAAVTRLRHLFDVDSDPQAVAEVLGRDGLLRPALALLPGLRVPGHADGNELAVRAVLGQQVSVAGARTLAARLVAEHGTPLPRVLREPGEADGLTHTFPSPEVVASLSPRDFAMPARRAAAVIDLADALAAGKVALAPGADREQAARRLAELPGIGPWTIAYIEMRALADPDAFLASDLGVRRALERAGLPGDPRSVEALAERWRPYRAYALQYLWSGALGPAGPAAGRPSEKEQSR
ncbi:MAG TPA: AlkA N-terminal domain-containing protein [Acidimicrobiales bacterium]|nr:AlkA N-terminal domain-containing protein [Acidimicrobiales bacterium]